MTAQLLTHNRRVLVDDRPLPAGDKLRYARLLGLPHTIVLSPDRPTDELEVINRWTGRTTTATSSHIHQITAAP
ncbi:hypothetical protein LRS74_33305 [Streptomyces sp. LX-29]|uniref:His/Gly/Thr/Pro-type tRNA ligase C-terminal domain-containing protein n=1 Tax=Streptomyces sp. LX-29 TaxID=2900152 RepID=UPI00240E0C4A|nr:His/Gly/Thr/Pro-type tRNA ligase C-terminal domain-containing protein [Streptomyces sp. LX-29]WFB11970.1 hypothetical protein LRS74_33305 [Streptomyces sp. LX-29]